MINIVDLLWIEQRGMSIITAIFFFGAFISMGSLFWWFKREINDIDAELAHHKLRLNDLCAICSKMTLSVCLIFTLQGASGQGNIQWS